MLRINPTGDKADITIDEAVTRAHEICRKNGSRLTRLREQIYKLIWVHKTPLGAYAIMELLEKNSDREHVAPPTVYRTLDFLQQEGLVHRVHSLNAYIISRLVYGEYGDTLFICSNCGFTEEVCNKAIQQAINLSASQKRFIVEQQFLEIQGLCRNCRKGPRNLD